jgi:hypothetical protein
VSQAEEIPSSPEHRSKVTDAWLWFGVLGGAIAWLLHLLLAYAIAEFGCVSDFRDVRWLEFSGVAWLIGGMSALTLALAIWADIVAQRNGRYFAGEVKATRLEDHDPRVFMARSGVLSNRIFIFIIAAQTLPILYYLRDC